MSYILSMVPAYMALLLIYIETPSCARFVLAFLSPVSGFLKRVDLVIGRFRSKSVVVVKKFTLHRSSQFGNTLRFSDLEKIIPLLMGRRRCQWSMSAWQKGPTASCTLKL